VLCPAAAGWTPDDVAFVAPEQVTLTPTGAAFLKPGVRQGVLPQILAALMTARATTRAALKQASGG
jgi:DNA polymerase delta subunit 1